MNAQSRFDAAARERHRTLDFIGLRAHATTVGLIQLCEELLNSGVLTPEGLDRIKSAIRTELTVSNSSRATNHADFDNTLRRRIDSIFPGAPGEQPKEPIGSAEAFEDALSAYHGA